MEMLELSRLSHRMADEEVLPPRIEIPWQLASTTQPLAVGDPDGTTISLFVFHPDDEQLTRALVHLHTFQARFREESMNY